MTLCSCHVAAPVDKAWYSLARVAKNTLAGPGWGVLVTTLTIQQLDSTSTNTITAKTAIKFA